MRPPFPTHEYTTFHFSPQHLLSVPCLDSVCPAFAALPPQKGAVSRIDPSAILIKPPLYATHFTSLLSLAFQTQVIEARASTVHIAPLRLHTERRPDLPSTASTASTSFRVHIPGIREDIPKLAIGDKLELRGLFPQQQWVTPEVVEAEVVGLTKSVGYVYLRSNELAMMDLQLPKDVNRAAAYQIRFEVAMEPVCVMQDAVSPIDQLSLAETMVAGED